MTKILDPLVAADAIGGSYRKYLTSTFGPRRPELAREFERVLSSGVRLSKGPYLQASAPFVAGASTSELIAEGVLSKGFEALSKDAFPLDRPLHLHQEQAIRKAVSGRNLVVATGTGSGKTESFLVPIVDALLREQEAGTLSQPGVRALLLYPMNALANDQVKRLRRMLIDLPEITFGRYIGETKHTPKLAEDSFAGLFPGEPRVPNELLSREEMQTAPPHLLLTNYAMLEYLLLRPKDSALFDGPTGEHWRFVVLDEAHVYNGAQGTEVAMLLRRVRDRVVKSEVGRLQCFATSATLGQGREDYPNLIEFGQNLFGEPFEFVDGAPERQDIVEATRMPLVQSSAGYALPQDLYLDLQETYRIGAATEVLGEKVASTCQEAPQPTRGEQPAAYLARVLRTDRNVVHLQQRLEVGSVDLTEIASDIFTGPTLKQAIVSLIDLCVVARERADDAPLIPARYHYFLRSLEGAFLCQHPNHRSDVERLSLARHTTCRTCAVHGDESQMFELGVCRNCRAEYLVGHIDDGRGVFRQAREFESGLVYLLLGDPIDEDDEDQAAADVVVANLDLEAGAVCPGCGALSQGATLVSGCACTGSPTPVRVTIVRPPQHDVLHRCAACASRSSGEIVGRFMTGTDAPVSVIATQLYQQIPPSSDPALADHVGEGRKLLSFSDSRQDAAFFASYFERTYNRAIQRRLIAQAISDLSPRDTPRSDDIVTRVKVLAEQMYVLDPDAGAHENRSEVEAWLTSEVLALDRRQSLEGTGSAEISVAVPVKFQNPKVLANLGFTREESVDLLQMLFETVRASGAMTVPEGVDIRDERFAPRNFEFGLRRTTPESKVISWLPGSKMNRRLEILTKVFDARSITDEPRALLDEIWTGITQADSSWAKTLLPVQSKKFGTVFRLDWSRLEFTPLSDDHRPGRCNTCHRIWWRTIANVCPTWRCSGSVTEVADLNELRAGHYASLYRDLEPIAMSVQEHTAQWSPARAAKIQEDFVAGRVNALSCSTTFELGVDVGEVQSVLLRNVPPTPANYVQRAGRAGRRTDSAALVVTFAQRRSHDRAHFDNPIRLVDGHVAPPVIMLENSAIGRRHAHSVAFAAYERMRVDQGHEPHHTVASFFGPSAADAEFVSWLRGHPRTLHEALSRILPDEVASEIGLRDWKWVDALVETELDDDPTSGWLKRAGDEVRDQLEQLTEAMELAVEEQKFGLASQYKRVQAMIESQTLLNFLASRNVLPKYGFPVDVVPLDLTGTGDADAASLDLTRDLALAISDYAPGSEVVAAKAVWQSNGLQTRAGQHWPTYSWAICAECGAFQQQHAVGKVERPCKVCESTAHTPGKGGTFVLPVFGFVGSRKAKVGESRPPKLSITERYYGSFGDEPVAELEPCAELSGNVLVQSQTTRQGRINIINRGPLGRGYRICDWCGHGEPAPLSVKKGKPPAHDDLRRPGKQCGGMMRTRQLGHHLLTDVTEISVGIKMDEDVALSLLYALLEGVEALDIARNDVGGTLHVANLGRSPHLIINDEVPGGAGHARRIAENLLPVFRRALSRVESCECGEETSCYGCLRNYRNQNHHEVLSRGAARDVLRMILGSAPKLPDFSELHDDARPFVAAAVEAGYADFEIGAECEAPEHWPIEVTWPEAQVALVVDAMESRDDWLLAGGWTVVRASNGVLATLIDALRAGS